MARRSYQIETHEDAYKAWREAGHNFAEAKRILGRKGYFITVPTLIDWADKFDWKGRAARAEAEEGQMKTALSDHNTGVLFDLVNVKTRYDKYFEGLGEGKIDNQAMYAYTGIIKSIAEVKTKTGEYKASLFIEFMRDLIEWLSKHDPGLVEAIGNNFDEFIAYAREKYAA